VGPESVEQARNFEKMHSEAVRKGLCSRCASQCAYGRQHGFSTVHPPCGACAFVVASWPNDRGNGWRLYAVRARKRGAHETLGGQTPSEAGALPAGASQHVPEAVRAA
jgi:hypothetical protein